MSYQGMMLVWYFFAASCLGLVRVWTMLVFKAPEVVCFCLIYVGEGSHEGIPKFPGYLTL